MHVLCVHATYMHAKRRLAVWCFQSVSKASTFQPLHTLIAEFGWDLILVCAEWPIAQMNRLSADGMVVLPVYKKKDFTMESIVCQPLGSTEQLKANTSSRGKLNLSRSPNKVGSHAYNACSQLSRLRRMYHFQHMDIVFRQSRLFSSHFYLLTDNIGSNEWLCHQHRFGLRGVQSFPSRW